MKKKLSSPTTRVILSIILGIIIGVFVCFLAIRSGFTYIKSTSVASHQVSVLGFSIFDIQRMGDEFKGIPNNSNMMFIGIIFSMILAVFTEVIVAFKNRRKEKSK